MRAAVRRVFDLVPLTPLGLLVGIAAAFVLREMALEERDLVLVVACGGLLGLLALSVSLVVLGAIRVKLAARVQTMASAERTIETARSLPSGFALPGLFLVPLLQVRWEWESPEAELELRRQGLRLYEDVTLPRRGNVRSVRRRIVIHDAFGLARVAIRNLQQVDLHVLPHSGALREMPLLVSMAGGDEVPHPMGLDDGDRVDLRRYAPGDPARHIHWKIFGRTRKLMVKMPERALSRARRTVAYLVSGPDDEASAAAARVAIEGAAFGAEWMFGADGSDGEATAVSDAIERIVRSAEAKDDGARAFRTFVERAERTGPSSLIVFAPPRPGPWLERVMLVLRSRGRRARVVIGVDGIDGSPPRSLWARIAMRAEKPEGTPITELDSVLHTLASARCEIVVIDRKTGRRLGDVHRSRARSMARAA
jgi:hypothetical protein